MKQHFHYVSHFAEWVAAVYANCPHPDVQHFLLENVTEEEGLVGMHGAAPVRHSDLLLEFGEVERYLDESLWRYKYLRYEAGVLTTDVNQMKYLATAVDQVQKHYRRMFHFDPAQRFSCYSVPLGQLPAENGYLCRGNRPALCELSQGLPRYQFHNQV